MKIPLGVSDLYGLLRGEMPVRPQSRTQVLEARAGESEYIRYDRAIARVAVEWLRQEAPVETRPWCLFVGFVSPRFPLVVPDQYFRLYRPRRSRSRSSGRRDLGAPPDARGGARTPTPESGGGRVGVASHPSAGEPRRPASRVPTKGGRRLPDRRPPL
ncbi:MAG: hypothetical protein HY002_12615 [Candidatus Rokubacteria bacterium]|nr:hypothetical protein [Candidatus Rokubacteria bacterium]